MIKPIQSERRPTPRNGAWGGFTRGGGGVSARGEHLTMSGWYFLVSQNQEFLDKKKKKLVVILAQAI